MAGDPTNLDDESAYVYVKKWRPVNEQKDLRAEKIYGQKQTIIYSHYSEQKDIRRTMSRNKNSKKTFSTKTFPYHSTRVLK